MNDVIPREFFPRVFRNWVHISSWRIIGGKNQDFNHWTLRNLKNTSTIDFYVLDNIKKNVRKLEIPEFLWEKIWEYLRNINEIEENENYRLPNWLKNYPVNCESFVYFIKWWFENQPNSLNYYHLETTEDIEKVKAGDVLYIFSWDKINWEYWHYMIYLWNWFCISKDWDKELMITRHILQWMYLVSETKKS